VRGTSDFTGPFSQIGTLLTWKTIFMKLCTDIFTPCLFMWNDVVCCVRSVLLL